MKKHTITIKVSAPNRMECEDVLDVVTRTMNTGLDTIKQAKDWGDRSPDVKNGLALRFKTISVSKGDTQ